MIIFSISGPAEQTYFRQTIASLKAILPTDGLAFDPDWPPLAQMLAGWLHEAGVRCDSVNAAATAAVKPAKLQLNISVAYLACLLRCFHEEVTTGSSASALIRWASAHFSAKRRQEISPGSLAKEFYSVDQFTAARTRDLSFTRGRQNQRVLLPGSGCSRYNSPFSAK